MSALREGATTVVRREDYTAPAYWIDTVDLSFDLDPAKTRVLNRMRLRRNADVPAQALRLAGEDLNLARVLVNGGGCSFKMDGQTLVLENLPEGTEPFDLEIFTTCAPEKNTQLMGLYVSQGTFFTQCEAEGFRRITYFLDRPDVMASYTVTLRADKAKYPLLLSNGNLVEQGDLDDGRHFARWVDPHRQGFAVERRALGHLGAAGKGDQAHFDVLGRFLEEQLGRLLRGDQPGGRDVGHAHAQRDVHGQDDGRPGPGQGELGHRP